MLPLALIPAGLQAGIGLYQTIKGSDAAKRNKAADQNLLNQRRDLASNALMAARQREQQAQLAARRGYDPAQMTQLQQKLGSVFNTQAANVRNMGGSRGQQMANLANLALNEGNAQVNVAAQDAAMQRQNQMYADQLGNQTAQYGAQLGDVIGNEYGIQRADYQQRAQGAAALQGAGLQNILGSVGTGASAFGAQGQMNELQGAYDAQQPGYGFTPPPSNPQLPGDRYDPTTAQRMADGGKVQHKNPEEMSLLERVQNLLNENQRYREHMRMMKQMEGQSMQEGGKTEEGDPSKGLPNIGTIQEYMQRPDVMEAVKAYTLRNAQNSMAPDEFSMLQETYPNMRADYFQDQRGMQYFVDETGNIVGMRHASGQTPKYYDKDTEQFIIDYDQGMPTPEARGGTGFWGHANRQYGVPSETIYNNLVSQGKAPFDLQEEMVRYNANPELQQQAQTQGGMAAGSPPRIVYLNPEGEWGAGTASAPGVIQQGVAGLPNQEQMIQRGALSGFNFDMGDMIPTYEKGGKIPSFAKGGKAPMGVDIMAIGISPKVSPKSEGYKGGKTEGGVKEPIEAKVIDKETGETKQPVILHGMEYVFDAPTSKEMETLASEEKFEELGKLVAERIQHYEERDASINDDEGMEDMEEEMEVEEEIS